MDPSWSLGDDLRHHGVVMRVVADKDMMAIVLYSPLEVATLIRELEKEKHRGRHDYPIVVMPGTIVGDERAAAFKQHVRETLA